MPDVELSAGTIEYEDTGGGGPVIVLLHGVMMDSTVWQHVIPGLTTDFRCVRPILPLGSHRRPMRDDADLSLLGLAGLVGEFLERLDLRDVTLVVNDWGGPQLLVSEGRTERIARLVLCACEAFDNYPPGLPGRALELVCRIPGGLAVLTQVLRLRPLRRLPGSWGWMSKRPVPHEVMDAWFRPARVDPLIRRDLAKYVTSTPPKQTLLDWAGRMGSFGKPVLVAWATEDRLMPREHGRRLAELFPSARLVEIADSYTLVPFDQPEVLTGALSEFLRATAQEPG